MPNNEYVDPLNFDYSSDEIHHDDSEVIPKEVEETEVEPVTKSTQHFDPNEFGESVAKHLVPLLKPAEKAPELTPAEIAKLTNEWQPDDKFLDQLFGDEEGITREQQVAALAQMRDGMMRQSMTLASYYIQQQLAPLQQQLQQFQQVNAETTGAEKEQQFFAKYPALNDFKEITVTVAKAIDKTKFTSEDQLLAAIAKETAQMIKKLKPDFALESVKPKPKHQAPQLATQQIGSQGGTAGNPFKPNLPPAAASAGILKFS